MPKVARKVIAVMPQIILSTPQVRPLDLNVNDLPKDHGSDDLQHRRDHQNCWPQWILKEDAHICGIHGAEHDHHKDRQGDEDSGSESALSRANFYLAIDAEAIADDAGETIENFSEVSAGFLLNEQSCHEELHVDDRDALG